MIILNEIMKKKVIVPPIKCQGIKTKIVPHISKIVPNNYDRWVEPFLGSCVVPLNIRPKSALLADSNVHIISLYQNIQNGAITGRIVRDYLENAHQQFQIIGEPYYYEVRSRFNEHHDSLDFLFLNRSCFNGMMRFGPKGFNVPFCKKTNRFRQAYITKIVNQVNRLAEISNLYEWSFRHWDFRQTLQSVNENDLVYVDPPYQGRHTDYFNSWDESTDKELIELLRNTNARFIYSTWIRNDFRVNEAIDKYWKSQFNIHEIKHFYHVGGVEKNRNPVIEGLITNYDDGISKSLILEEIEEVE